MRRPTAVLILAAVAVLAIAVPSAISDSGWREISGYRATVGDRVDFVLRFKGTDGVLTESRGGTVERTSSCKGLSLVETYGDPIIVIKRETSSAEECFAFATGSVLGFGKLRAVASDPAEALDVDGRRADRLTGFPPTIDWSELTIDRETELPLRAVDRDGRVIEWHYDEFGQPSKTVVELPPPPVDWDETYQALTKGEARAAARLSRDVPDSISDLRFETAFSYGSTLLKQARTYIIWTSAGRGELQLIVSPGDLPAKTPTIEDLGSGSVAMNVQEDGVHVQIFASDLQLLREGVQALRPEYESKLP